MRIGRAAARAKRLECGSLLPLLDRTDQDRRQASALQTLRAVGPISIFGSVVMPHAAPQTMKMGDGTGVGQPFQAAGSGGFPAANSEEAGGWKASPTGRQECLPYKRHQRRGPFSGQEFSALI